MKLNLEESEREHRELLEKIEARKSRRRIQNEGVEKMKQELKELRALVLERNTQLAAAEREIEKQLGMNKSKDKQLEDAAQEIRETKESSEKTRQELERLKLELKTLAATKKETLEQKEKEINSLKAEMGTVTAEKKRVVEEVQRDLGAKRNQFETMEVDYKKQIKDLTDKLQRLNDHRLAVEKAAKELNEENEELTQKLEELTKPDEPEPELKEILSAYRLSKKESPKPSVQEAARPKLNGNK